MDESLSISLEEAEREVLDAIEDRLRLLQDLLARPRDGGADTGESLNEARRHVHSIKGAAAGVGASAIRAIAHRFEDYLSDVKHLEGAALADAQIFVDRLDEASEKRLDPPADEIARLCRDLPAKHAFDVADVEVCDIEIMLVMPKTASAHFVARELAECGYRIISVWSAPDALALAASMRPDFIIASNVMPDLSGVDVVCAIRAMPATQGIPVAVLSSERRGHPSLKGLPRDVALLSKSDRFADDVTEVFTGAGLL